MSFWKKGDWIAQNAANSAVGRSVIQIANPAASILSMLSAAPSSSPNSRALGADIVVTAGNRPPQIRRVSLRRAFARGSPSCRRRRQCLISPTPSPIGAPSSPTSHGPPTPANPNGNPYLSHIEFKGYGSEFGSGTSREKLEATFRLLAALSIEGLSKPIHRRLPLRISSRVEEAARGAASARCFSTSAASLDSRTPPGKSPTHVGKPLPGTRRKIIIYNCNPLCDYTVNDASNFDAEWQVMQIVWRRPAHAQDVVALSGDTDWSEATVRPSSIAFSRKKALSFEKAGKAYLTTAMSLEEECQRFRDKSFIQRVFGGSVFPCRPLHASEKLTPVEIAN